RYEDGVRRVASVGEILGLEGLTPLTQDIYRFDRQGRKGKSVLGTFAATGVVPRLVEELRERDVAVPMELFQKPRGQANGERAGPARPGSGGGRDGPGVAAHPRAAAVARPAGPARAAAGVGRAAAGRRAALRAALLFPGTRCGAAGGRGA